MNRRSRVRKKEVGAYLYLVGIAFFQVGAEMGFACLRPWMSRRIFDCLDAVNEALLHRQYLSA